jgi:hypothetical protein
MLEDIQKAIDLRDWYAVAGLALALAIQAHRRFPWLGARLWAKLPDGSKFLVPLLGGAVVAFVGAFLEGKPLVDALMVALGGAVTIGIGAMGVAAGLKESPLPWSGGAGGKPKDDDDKTPPTGGGGIAVTGASEFRVSGNTGDDTAAIQAHLDAGRKLSALPPGTYLVSRPLLIALALALTGCSSAPPLTAADAYQAALAYCADVYPLLPPEAHTKRQDEACWQVSKLCTDYALITEPPAVEAPAK